MKAAMEVGSKLSKLQSGRATAADVIEATGMMRSYLPPEQVDAWLEAFLRIDYRASTRQVRAYEVAKTNPDDDRTILNRKIKDENGNTFWLIGHDGHRVAEKEMFRGAYNKKMWNRKIMTGRDIEVEAAAMSSEGMFPRKIMDEIVDDMIGGGKSLSIYVHESVPLEFKEFILFHELIEAELALVDGVGLTDAHQQAVDETDKYARKHMSKEEFEGFKEWQDSVVAVDN